MANPPEDRGDVQQGFVAIPAGPPGSPVNVLPATPQPPMVNAQRALQTLPTLTPAVAQHALNLHRPAQGPGDSPRPAAPQTATTFGVGLGSIGPKWDSREHEREGRLGRPDPGFLREIPDTATLKRRQAQWISGQGLPGNQHLAVGAAAVKLTPADFAMSATVVVSGGDVRVCFDGTAAALANGVIFGPGSVLKLTGKETLRGFSAVGVGNAAALDVVYWE